DSALEQKRRAHRYWYVADMNLAQQAWQAADMSRLQQLLNRQRPETGAEDLRSFDWYYLWRLSHAARQTLAGHRQGVLSLAVSPDGKTIASGSGDRTVKLWDATTGSSRAP